jgi:hypothetical protein
VGRQALQIKKKLGSAWNNLFQLKGSTEGTDEIIPEILSFNLYLRDKTLKDFLLKRKKKKPIFAATLPTLATIGCVSLQFQRQ